MSEPSEPSGVKIAVQMMIDLSAKDLEAMACVMNKGPTNRKLPHKLVVEWWGQYLLAGIESGKAANHYYANAPEEKRREIDALMAKHQRESESTN